MSVKQELLNTTTDSSQTISFEADPLYVNYSAKGTKSAYTPINVFSVSESKAGGSLIVHPSYSQSPSKAFHGRIPEYSPITQGYKLNAFSKTSSIPPQEYGGMFDELLAKDAQFKMQMTENELDSNYFSCYKCWIVLLIPLSIVFSIGSLWVFLDSDLSVPSSLLIMGSILSLWNSVQCFMVLLAMRSRCVAKAEKSVVLFSLFLIVLFLCTILGHFVFGHHYMNDYQDELKFVVAVLVAFAVPLVFYFTTVSGAVKVYHILKRRKLLEISTDTSREMIPEL